MLVYACLLMVVVVRVVMMMRSERMIMVTNVHGTWWYCRARRPAMVRVGARHNLGLPATLVHVNVPVHGVMAELLKN